MKVITSSSNPQLRRLERLREGRFRRRQGQFLVDGLREIRRAVAAGLPWIELYVRHRHVDQPGWPGHDLAAAARADERLVCVSDTAFAKLAFGDRDEGAVALFATPERPLEALTLPRDPLVVVLDGVEKPGNVGAVFRSADAAGADAVICCGWSGDLFNPNLIRSSLGTVFSMPAATGTRDAVAVWLDQRQIRPLAARVEAAQSLWATDMRGPLAIVLGSEAEGLQGGWDCQGVAIPMAGRADSLNVSVTAAVLLFEAARQRLATGD